MPLQRPLVHHQRRRGAEGHHVGEAVVLGAERALGAGQARHAAVQAVEHHGDEDRDRRLLEARGSSPARWRRSRRTAPSVVNRLGSK